MHHRLLKNLVCHTQYTWLWTISSLFKSRLNFASDYFSPLPSLGKGFLMLCEFELCNTQGRNLCANISSRDDFCVQVDVANTGKQLATLTRDGNGKGRRA